MHCGDCIVVMLVSILPEMPRLIINYYPSPPLSYQPIVSSQPALSLRCLPELFSITSSPSRLQGCFDLYKLLQSLCLLSLTFKDINIYFKKISFISWAYSEDKEVSRIILVAHLLTSSGKVQAHKHGIYWFFSV